MARGKSRNFSIYLLKIGFDSSNALKLSHSLGSPVQSKKLPDGAVLYILDTTPKDPWWKSYWGIENDLKQVLKGAIVFIRVDCRNFALTFGHAYHNLKPESYEYDFGVLTTLNAIDPKKIKSTDIFLPETARRERIQSPTAAQLTFFDINTDESIFKSLAGAVKEEYFDLFRHVSGASNVRISSKINSEKISDLCSRLLCIYNSEDFKTTFPNIQNIQPVKDPTVINSLNKLLVNAVNNQDDNVILTIPDIFNPNISTFISYAGSGRHKSSFNSVNIEDFYEYLLGRKVVEIDIVLLKKNKLRVKNENNIITEEYSIYNSLLFDCELSGKHYHLCDANWYLIDEDFLREVGEELDPYFMSCEELPKCYFKREDDYNSNVAKNNKEFICLDRKSIAPSKQTQIEPCDLFTIKNEKANLIHIKISTRSSTLSHLFNQGVNSIELVRLNSESKEKLKSLVGNKKSEYINKSEFIVTFGIITKKDPALKSNSLPLFSRVSLKRSLKSLQLMGVEGEVVLIKDKVAR